MRWPLQADNRFYPDQTRGIPKTSESRAIEAVMNAVVLARRDARSGRLSDDTRTALDVMWSLQMKTGPNNGAWTWLNFQRQHGTVSLLNQLMGLWAAGVVPDLLTADQRSATIAAAFAAQQADGGWSTSSLGTFQRVDKTLNETRSDGYGTALACLALQAAGAGADLRHALAVLFIIRSLRHSLIREATDC